jgi:tetratricopeptide (TPR) repeat protein
LRLSKVSEIERGRGWTILGSAYAFQGRYQEAATAYENALQILRKRDQDAAEYASALSAFGTLYRDMSQFDAAARMEMHALQVDKQINDHAGVAVDCASLADLERCLKSTRKASRLRIELRNGGGAASDYGNSTIENAIGNSKLCFWASAAIQGLPSSNCSAEEKAPTVSNS